MNFPAMKRARMYKKPGVYLSGPLLGVPWRYAAVAEPAIAPPELLASVLDIGFPVCLERRTIPAWPQMDNSAGKLSHFLRPISEKEGAVAMAALGHGRGSGMAGSRPVAEPRNEAGIMSSDFDHACVDAVRTQQRLRRSVAARGHEHSESVCRSERRRCSTQARDGKDDPRAGCGGHPPHPVCRWLLISARLGRAASGRARPLSCLTA